MSQKDSNNDDGDGTSYIGGTSYRGGSLGGGSLNTAVARAIRDEVMSLLGHLGAPDLLTVNHGSIPHIPGDALQLSHSNALVLKARLLVKVYGLLWADQDQG